MNQSAIVWVGDIPVTMQVQTDSDGNEFVALSVPDGCSLEGEEPGVYYPTGTPK